MDTVEWAKLTLHELEQASQDYRQKALYLEVSSLIDELVARREHHQGELDGTLWSPNKWRDGKR